MPRALTACVLLLLASAGCAAEESGGIADRHVEPLVLTAVGPGQIVPGTVLRIRGGGFAHPDYGVTRVEIRGSGDAGAFELVLDADWLAADLLEVTIDRGLFDRLGGAGLVEGGLRLVHRHESAGVTRTSSPLPIRWRLHESLEPPSALTVASAIHVNDPIEVSGGGVLFGGNEGETRARVWGCFFPQGSERCRSVEPTEVVIEALDPMDRGAGAFPFAPAIAGVGPGTFRGTVELLNVHGPEAGSARLEGAHRTVEVRILAPAVHDVSTVQASLGQYLDIRGGGFAGGTEEAVTLLELRGTFRSAMTDNERSVDVLLVPDFRGGRQVRYVLSEEDPLGQAINLRRERGTITGTVQPVIRYRDQEARGAAAPFAFDIAPVRQVVYLSFHASYVESLRHFGLRAADDLVRERILTAAREPYQGVNVDLRTELPTDFAIYSHVDLVGPDPNGTGLFGYDNSPGKDTNNLRLHDRIGGVNATTQLDGYPGYGGVFVESFMGFSEDPGSLADPLPGASSLFDAVFDPFRPDRGGRPVTEDELQGPLPAVRDGTECPAPGSFRPGQIACAIWVLGNLVGTTVAHEVGHSLGLANPHGDGFHNDGDLPGRLMDSGGARPFEERAQLMGANPGIFCGESYEYLREIMPGEGEDPLSRRPSCN